MSYTFKILLFYLWNTVLYFCYFAALFPKYCHIPWNTSALFMKYHFILLKYWPSVSEIPLIFFYSVSEIQSYFSEILLLYVFWCSYLRFFYVAERFTQIYLMLNRFHTQKLHFCFWNVAPLPQNCSIFYITLQILSLKFCHCKKYCPFYQQHSLTTLKYCSYISEIQHTANWVYLWWQMNTFSFVWMEEKVCEMFLLNQLIRKMFLQCTLPTVLSLLYFSLLQSHF